MKKSSSDAFELFDKGRRVQWWGLVPAAVGVLSLSCAIFLRDFIPLNLRMVPVGVFVASLFTTMFISSHGQDLQRKARRNYGGNAEEHY